MTMCVIWGPPGSKGQDGSRSMRDAKGEEQQWAEIGSR